MNLRTILSRRHEDYLAEVLPDTERVAGSGSKRDSQDAASRPTDDNEDWRFRYQAKETQRRSISIKLEDWNEVKGAANARNERPAFAIRIDAEGEDPPVLLDGVLVDLNDWAELLWELDTLRGYKNRQSLP